LAEAAAKSTTAKPTVSEPTVSEPTVSEPTVSEPTVSEPTVAKSTRAAKSTLSEPATWAEAWARVEASTGDRRLQPGVVEAFPLGIGAAAAIPPTLHLIGRVDRAIGSAERGPRATVAAGVLSWVVEPLDRSDPVVLCDSCSCFGSVTKGAAPESPTWRAVASLSPRDRGNGNGQQKQ
jgi:hypothetical protein